MTGNDQNRPSQWRISTTANSPLVRNCRSPPPTGTIATWGKFRPDSCLESFDWESFKLIKLKPHFPQTSFEAGLDKLRCRLTLALSLAHSVTVTLPIPAHSSSLWLALALPGSLWLSLVLSGSTWLTLVRLSQALIGSQGPYSLSRSYIAPVDPALFGRTTRKPAWENDKKVSVWVVDRGRSDLDPAAGLPASLNLVIFGDPV